jgi:hypothetical protein
LALGRLLGGFLSISYISEKTKIILWGKSAGRCNYCNRKVYLDDFTKHEFNSAYIAHIVADKPEGPRGHPTESERLKSDLSNLMLVCDVHHRLIDKVDIDGHPVELLRAMKAEHEKRVEIQTEAQSKESHVVLYGAKIGQHDSFLTWNHARVAITPERYPADTNAIEISLQNSAVGDDESDYWQTERKNLNRNFDRNVRRLITAGQIRHLSVLALAPQPLLIELGRLICDLRETDVFQLQREPTQTWRWNHDNDNIEFTLVPAADKKTHVALNISLSATIDDSRIQAVLGDDVSIWTLTINTPHNDFLKSSKTLSSFRKSVRDVFEKIKKNHGQDTILKVFPAMSVATAVEFGRVWQPKADMEMIIYDQNRNRGGFVEALTIQNKDFSKE